MRFAVWMLVVLRILVMLRPVPVVGHRSSMALAGWATPLRSLAEALVMALATPGVWIAFMATVFALGVAFGTARTGTIPTAPLPDAVTGLLAFAFLLSVKSAILGFAAWLGALNRKMQRQ